LRLAGSPLTGGPEG